MRQAADRRELRLHVVGDGALAPGDACIAWDGGGLTLDAAARAAAIREEMAALLGDDPARISHPANLAAPAPPIMNG